MARMPSFLGETPAVRTHSEGKATKGKTRREAEASGDELDAIPAVFEG